MIRSKIFTPLQIAGRCVKSYLDVRADHDLVERDHPRPKVIWMLGNGSATSLQNTVAI